MTFIRAFTGRRLQATILIFIGFAGMGMGQNHGSTSTSAGSGAVPTSGPPTGELCAPGSNYDSVNCYFGTAPAGTTAFIWANNFYSTPLPGKKCPVGWYDGANCFVRTIPSAYAGFIYQNNWYTGRNPHFIAESTKCPSDFTYDGANCYYKTAGAGMRAEVLGNVFYEVSTSRGIHLPKQVKAVPVGSGPFVYNNSWYIKPVKNGAGVWFEKSYITGQESTATPVCRSDVITPTRSWTLSWSDEFNDQPEGTQCYNTNDLLQCITQPYWSGGNCGPTNWSSLARNTTWTADQKSTYGGLVNLNKCHWKVYDSFNTWDLGDAGSGTTSASLTDSFRPENVRVEGGILKMFTKANPPQGGSYDCGRAYPGQGFTAHTSNCPYSGANIQSDSGLPWTDGNNEHSSDPNRRYVGKTYKFGRIEVRAKIAHAGHGMWPALWLFVDKVADPTQGGAELDMLEYISDLDGASDQLTKPSVTYGMAWQTAHNWGVGSYPHISQGVGLPISVGDWHVYAVEYEPTEIRFYIDNCLRNRIVEGQLMQSNGKTQPFHIPTGQTLQMLIGNPASAAAYFPAWYRASNGNNTSLRPDFQPTELDVDYVRYYVDPALGLSKTNDKTSEHSPDRKIASVPSADEGKTAHPFEQRTAPGVVNQKSWWKFW